MRTKTKRMRFLGIAFVAAVASIGSIAHAKVLHVYLTWQGDTSRTMTVNYQTDAEAPSKVFFDRESRGGDPTKYAETVEGTPHQVDGLEIDRWIHSVELTGLKPATRYYFVVGDPTNGYSEEFSFETLPADDRPLRFVTGGDMGVGDFAPPLLKHAAKQNPLVAIIGGDIAYVNGDLSRYKQWDAWIDQWEEYMVAPDGRMIPMILAIGNHETNRKEGGPTVRAPFYFGYFAQNGETPYFVRRLGANAIMIALDSGHIVSHADQVPWLRGILQEYADVPYTFAVYHVPLYPSHREYEGGGSVAGRKAWLPVFDEFGLTAAFENHDHTFKRSKLLRGDKPDPNGTLYLGDGDFGRGPRTTEKRWYLEKWASTPHFWVVDVTKEKVTYRAIDSEGNVFDTYTQSPK